MSHLRTYSNFFVQDCCHERRLLSWKTE